MRAMWSGERRGLRFDGRYYQLAGVHPGPVPAHPIQVWIGANMPRALALTGRVADGWVSPLMSYKPPREAARANLAIDRAAREAGRDPREIRRIYNVQGAFTSTTPRPGRRHRPRHRRPTRALGRGPDAPRARPRLRHVRARHPARPARRSPPSSRTSHRGSANAWPSGEPPPPCSPYPGAARVSSRARLRGDPGDRPRADAVPDAARRPRGHPRRARRRRTPRGSCRRRACLPTGSTRSSRR